MSILEFSIRLFVSGFALFMISFIADLWGSDIKYFLSMANWILKIIFLIAFGFMIIGVIGIIWTI